MILYRLYGVSAGYSLEFGQDMVWSLVRIWFDSPPLPYHAAASSMFHDMESDGIMLRITIGSSDGLSYIGRFLLLDERVITQEL